MTGAWIVESLVVVAGVVLLGWLVLMIGLLLAYPGRVRVRELMRLLPDLVRFVRRLLTDARVPRGVRAVLWLLVAYLACPIDVIPDFIPVLGYADDVILALLAVRRAIRRTDPGVIRDCWPGSGEGLDTLLRLSRAADTRAAPDGAGDRDS